MSEPFNPASCDCDDDGFGGDPLAGAADPLAGLGAPLRDQAKAQQLERRLLAVQKEITAAELTGTAGDGLVQVTGNGVGEVSAVVISPDIDRDDLTGLQELIVAALADLARARQTLVERTMNPIAAGIERVESGLSGAEEVPRTSDGLIDMS
ncbi:YbaB/EbfC family nucleoid-associated protein [Gordonia hirsuta]|uniref:YbaB/EbfC family nucleoid-associated protein n=1 Tax=Gordonia hirsuta TaxID=53427 RepID=UPI00034557FB|nr:YbaB/EbfC family nucleoid-associated protein [Gordonia hirsuta]